jgi:photosystem II stability/assembly factor-like uncharacterized protein
MPCVRLVRSADDLLVCAARGGLWKTRLHYWSWEYLGLADTSLEEYWDLGVQDVAAAAGNPEMLLVNFRPDTFTGHGNYRSTDGGDTWTPADSGLAFNPAPGVTAFARFQRFLRYPGVIYGISDWVYRSTSFGAAWEFFTTIGSLPGEIYSVQVSPMNPGFVLAGGENSFFGPTFSYSVDSGRTWTYIELAGTVPVDNAVYSIAVEPANDSVVYLGMWGAVIRSADRGTTWRVPLVTDRRGRPFRALLSDTTLSGDLWAAAGNTLMHTTDGGEVWDTSAAPYAGSAEILDMAIDYPSSTLILATADGVWIRRIR